MADLSVTAANVRAGDPAGTDKAVHRTVTAGETITAGQCVYKQVSDDEWYLADADTVGSDPAEVAGGNGVGVALTNAGDGEPLIIQTSGIYVAGATTVKGEVYVVSDTAGNIRPAADGVSGDYTTILGVGSSTTEIELKPFASGYDRA